MATEEAHARTATQRCSARPHKVVSGNESLARLALPRKNIGEDPDWNPYEPPPKKLKRTYSARGTGVSNEISRTTTAPAWQLQSKQLRNANLRPGRKGSFTGINSTTGSLREGYQSVDTSADEVSSKTVPDGVARRKLRDLAKATTNSWMVYDGLYAGVDALLKATKAVHPHAQNTCKSLFTLCLQKVPAYIAGEQAIADEADPESKEDVSEEVYTELEGWSTSDKGGWKPLREVVRAHGIYMIESAIRKGAIPIPLSRQFLDLCIGHHAIPEAKALCTAILEAFPRAESPIDSSVRPGACGYRGSPLSILDHLNTKLDPDQVWGFVCSSLTNLLQSGILSAESLATYRLETAWEWPHFTLLYFSHGSPEAALLITEVVLASYWCSRSDSRQSILQQEVSLSQNGKKLVHKDSRNQYPRQSIHTSTSLDTERRMTETTTAQTSELVAKVAVAVQLGPKANLSFGSGEAAWKSLLQAMACHALQSCELETSAKKRTAPLNSIALARRAMPSLGLHLASSVESSSPFFHLVLPSQNDREAIDTFAAFVIRLAVLLSQEAQEEVFPTFQSLINRLLDLGRIHPEAPAAAEIALAAAFIWAEGTERQAHLDWALEIEEAVQNGYYGLAHANRDETGDTVEPPARKRKSLGSFRWEPSIGEWVTKTPLPRKSTKAVAPGQRVRTVKAVCIPQDVRRLSTASEPAVPATPSDTNQSGVEEHSPAPKRHRGRPPRAAKSWSPKPAGPMSPESLSEDDVNKASDAAPSDGLMDGNSTTRRNGAMARPHQVPSRQRGRPPKKARGRGRPPRALKPVERRLPSARCVAMSKVSKTRFDILTMCSSEDELGF